VTVMDWKVSVTVSDEGSICKGLAAELLVVVNFVELSTICKPCMRGGGYLFSSTGSAMTESF
jgi:hypothetical protein